VLLLSLAPTASAYPWPVRPFNAQHAIRGAFDDPRSLRGSVDPTVDNPLSFHSGVDIQAPDGTPVYAVASGVVSTTTSTVAVSTGDGTIFGYWHIVPAVGSYQYVVPGSLLGHIRPGAGHVHLAEKRFGVYVNPLRLSGLSPYHDTKPPVIRGLVAYRCGTRVELPMDGLSGCIDLAVDSYDPSPLDPAPPWDGAILAPTRIAWHGLFPGTLWRPVGFHATTVDLSRFRTGDLRDVYAPGTRQNQPQSPGDYRFWLARHLELTFLEGGEHTISVTVTDERDNATTRALSFTVANAQPIGQRR
jgi:hypothetical protein